MFINNKYHKWYINIVTYRKSNPIINEYSERHHILPKSLGGDNTTYNLVRLSAREHFICHLLLVKMTTGVDQYRMKNAVAKFMQARIYQHRVLNSRQYSLCRKFAAECASFFKTGSKRSVESINKGIATCVKRYGGGSSRMNAILSDEQKLNFSNIRKSRNTYETWFINADSAAKKSQQSEWGKVNSTFVLNNPSLTESGKRKISEAKSPGIFVTPFGNLTSRYYFDQHPTCGLIGFEIVYYMKDKPNGVIKTRAINRARLPTHWYGKTWKEVGFDLIINKCD